MRTYVFVILLAILIISCDQSYTTVYVVDQKHHAANDSGPGTKNQPFKTINGAVGQVKAGDKILIYPGIYRESVEFKNSGEEGNPIIIEAVDHGNVIMQGSVVVTDWRLEPGKSSIYVYDGWTKYFGPISEKEKDARGKPRNQLFSDGTIVEEVFRPHDLKECSFYIDREKQRIHLWLLEGENPNKKLIEVSDREFLLDIGTNDYIMVKGIRFKHGTNGPQGRWALVRIRGNNCLVEDCNINWASATGLGLSGSNHIIRRCVFNHNGQQGFNIGSSIDCKLEDCESSYNNTHPNKTYSIGWEGGGNKIAFSNHLVIERHQAYYNNGHGIWFDISNTECEVKNSICSYNDGAGLYYEISYTLHAHDNVMYKNGLRTGPGTWVVNGGISLLASAGCLIERNILIGNVEGFQLLDYDRTTPATDEIIRNMKLKDVVLNEKIAILSQDEVICNNILAFNMKSQVKSWFAGERLLPEAMKTGVKLAENIEYQDKDEKGQLIYLTLEKANIKIDNNIYWGGSNPDLLLWGKLNYKSLKKANIDLKFEENGKVFDPQFADWENLDFRVPKDSPILQMGCYLQGKIPGVKLGTIN